TLLHYTRDLERLAGYCARAGIPGWHALEAGHVRAYAAELHRRGLSGRSIQRRLSAARAFYRYLLREGHVARDPAAGVPAPKSARRLPQALSPDEAARLLAFEGSDPTAVRDRALLELLYSSGLRL